VVDWTLIGVAAVLLLAALVRSAFGFGEALVAVPLLALLVLVEVAAPLAVLLSAAAASVVLVQDWRQVHFGGAWRLVLSTLFGVPLGLLLLMTVPEPAVKIALATVIVAFSSFCLVGRHEVELRDDRLAWAFGFVAGILGGAYGMNGPPLAVYGALRGWSAQRFRATLQGYFLPASLAVLLGYWLAGLLTLEVARLFLWSLPAIAAGILLGGLLNRRLEGGKFVRLVHGGLILSGAVLLAQTLWGLLKR
jgi:uncharacterized membrane protein YfcA